jgi:hypothetical protein
LAGWPVSQEHGERQRARYKQDLHLITFRGGWLERAAPSHNIALELPKTNDLYWFRL